MVVGSSADDVVAEGPPSIGHASPAVPMSMAPLQAAEHRWLQTALIHCYTTWRDSRFDRNLETFVVAGVVVAAAVVAGC